jgi:hypothetical protein
MTALLKYDAARQAVAECKTFDEVRDWEDKAAAVREYSRRIGDRAMELDAIEIREHARLRRGEMLLELEATGQLGPGKKKTVRGQGPIAVTLESLSISKNESAHDQKIAQLGLANFEERIARCRAYAEAHPEKHAFDVLRPPDTPINGARSIMNSRQEPDDSLDFFPTPPWATRALMEVVLGGPFRSIWEPACGYGHMAEVLREYCSTVEATDVFDYGYGQTFDFLDPDNCEVIDCDDWIITNPPFGEKTEAFVLRALELAPIGVAMFVRLQWLESVGRYETIFKDHPPTCIAFFAERVPLCKGEWKPDGTTATAYIWLVWIKGQEPRPPFWIPPGQRGRLTYADDAERFTVHPVISKGERIADDSRTNQDTKSVPDSVDTDAAQSSTSVSEPASAEPTAPHMPVGAGSTSLSEIILPGMAPSFGLIAAFVDVTPTGAANAS